MHLTKPRAIVVSIYFSAADLLRFRKDRLDRLIDHGIVTTTLDSRSHCGRRRSSRRSVTPRLDSKQADKYGEDAAYKSYAERTKMLVPFFY